MPFEELGKLPDPDDSSVVGELVVLGRIQSRAFVAGSSGWRILGDGSAEFNDVIVRGLLLVMDASGTESIVVGNEATEDIQAVLNPNESLLMLGDIDAGSIYADQIWASSVFAEHLNTKVNEWYINTTLPDTNADITHFAPRSIHSTYGYTGLTETRHRITGGTALGWPCNTGLLTSYHHSGLLEGWQEVWESDTINKWWRAYTGSAWTNWYSTNSTDSAVGPGATTTALYHYSKTDSASYRPSGWRPIADKVIQESWGFGDHIGCVAYDWTQIQADLAGKTIKSGTVWVQRAIGGYRAARTPTVWALASAEVNGSNNLVKSGQPDLVNGTLFTSTIAVSTGNGVKIPLSAAILADLKDGTARGLAFATSETLSSTGDENTAYMRFDGAFDLDIVAEG